MLGYQDTSSSLICAVREGRLERVREVISCYGLSYSQAWSEGYVLLCDAVVNKHTEVVKLLLTNGSRVNSKKRKRSPTDTPLHFAVVNGDIEIVRMLLDRGADINAENQCGITALHNAVKSKNMEIIELLVNQGAYVNARNSDNITPLHLAAEKGSTEIVKLLLKHGAYVNSVCTSKFREGYTPLFLAVKGGSEEVVTLLLESGANVDAQDKDGKTVLHFAVEKQKETLVKLLLECGANVDAEDKDGKTVLHFAAEKGHSLVIKRVLKHCPDVNNKSNRSALNVAVQGSGEEYGKIVENLLQYGFTVSPEDVNNCKLLHAAVENGYLKTVEELLKCGFDVNKLYKSTYGKGYMALHVATKNRQEEVAKLLISYGADVNAQDGTGKIPIFYAIQNADLKITELLLTNKANVKDNPELLNVAVKRECREIVEVLLEHGADVNSSDGCGRTALHITALGDDGCFFGYNLGKGPNINVKGEIAKLLLNRGANVNAQTKNGITTLHAATQKGYVKVVEALLEYNADVNCTDKTDKTPLHIAAQKGHLTLVAVLLKFGAIIDCQDGHGRTALHIASKAGHEQIVIALLEHGSDINVMSKDNYTPLHSAIAGVGSVYHIFNSYDSDDEYYYSHGGGICVCEIILDILKHHVVKLETANLYVSEKNLLTMSGRYFYLGSDFELPLGLNDDLSDFRKECEEEIANMKSEKVGNAIVSFYDILTKGISELGRYAGYESVVQILRSEDCKIKFPIYASMINCNFRKGERRKELLEQGNKFFHFLSNNFPQLPPDCTEEIFSYLGDEDLRRLINACKPISVSSPNTDINNVAITSNISKIS